MKKLSQHKNGYFLPYVLFISMLVFLNISTTIILYENKIKTQNNLNDLIEVETLIQMSQAKFLNEKVYNNKDIGNITYEHPNGHTQLLFTRIEESLFDVTATIYTINGMKHVKHFKIQL